MRTPGGVKPTLQSRRTREWLNLTVPERIAAFETDIASAIKEKAKDVRSRFYDTEFYSARVTDVWVWEARDHDALQLLNEALRETPFWDHYFEIVDILVGVENGYAKQYGTDTPATISVSYVPG